MPILLGIAAAVLWGTADFLARFSTRTIGTYRTLVYMQAIGVSVLTVWLAFNGELAHAAASHAGTVWAWALFSSVLSAVASLAFYRALEIGVLAVVAPVCSIYPVLTLLLSMYTGERVSRLHIGGIFVALLGVVLAATSFAPVAPTGAGTGAGPAHGHLTRGVGLALFASILYGLNFWVIGYHVMSGMSGLMSVWSVRLLGTLGLVAVAAPVKQSLRLPGREMWMMLAAICVCDTSAFVVSNIGLATGHVAVVTVFGSLFSAVTVFLAWVVLREKLERTQWLGIFLIFIGIILVSA
ncbi:MAG: DMT family transporter [Candidatus Acidiferrales bacterium]